MPESLSGTIPESVFCMFQLTFAIITYDLPPTSPQPRPLSLPPLPARAS